MYAMEWRFRVLDDDREMVRGKVRDRLTPLLRDLAGFRGLLVMVRDGVELSRFDLRTGESVNFDCCRVNCLALWDDEAGLLRASWTDLFRTFRRDELGGAVVAGQRGCRYEVVYQALPEGVGAETDVYGTIIEAEVQLENLEEAIGRTVSTVVPVLAAEQGFRGVLVLRNYDDLADAKRHRIALGADQESRRPDESGAGRRRDIAFQHWCESLGVTQKPMEAFQHWCVSLWETQKHMEESNELAWRSTAMELSDLIPRGWLVDRTNHEGAFLPRVPEDSDAANRDQRLREDGVAGS